MKWKADYALDMESSEPLRSKLAALYDIWHVAKTKLRKAASEGEVNISAQIRFLNSAFQLARSSLIAGRTKEQTHLLFTLYQAEVMAMYRPSDLAEAVIRRERLVQELTLKLFGEILP